MSVRLVYAEGGQGKTRLAAEFAARSATAGWTVAQARHRSEVASAGGGDEHLTVRAPGLALIIDYAERWPLEDLITLVRQHRDAARDRLRILLLSRPAGSWWQGLSHQLAKLDIFDAESIKLHALPDGPTVRAGMYTAARDRFAEIFAVTSPSRIAGPDQLDDPMFALTLTVHMRALVDVDAAFRGVDPPAGSHQAHLSSYLLDREHDYWRSSYDDGRGPVQTPDEILGRVVYTATLTRPLSVTNAAAVLGRARLADTTAERGQIVRDHARCYPPADSDLALEPLYPDRLGEDFLALTIPGREEQFGYYATDDWSVTAPTLLLAPTEEDTAPPPYCRQAVSVMIEAAHRWPHLTTEHLEPLLRQHPTLAVAAGSGALTRLADLATIDLEVLEGIDARMPDDRHVDLDIGAAALAQRLVAHRLAVTDDSVDQGRIRERLTVRLYNAGLYDAALAAAQDALLAWRPVAQTHVGYHEPGFGYFDRVLASTLTMLSNCLLAVGREAEALQAIEEAVRVCRRLASAAPVLYNPFLAGALGNLGNSLAVMGRLEEALDAADESVQVYRQAASADPARHDPNFATALRSLSGHLREMGRKTEAISPADEAAAISRRLATENPAAYEPDLAAALSTLSDGLHEGGRQADALEPGKEAVQVFRRLAEANPVVYEPQLAGALSNLGTFLREMGRHAEAEETAEEAVEVFRRLAQANPAVYESDLAVALNSMSGSLSDVGRHAEAEETAEEAVEVFRRLAQANPTAYEPRHAMALSNLSIDLSKLGRWQEAIAPADEAVVLFRRLAASNPAAYKADLAGALNNLSNALSEVGRIEDALDPIENTVEVWRELDEENPEIYGPNLAEALTNLSNRLFSLGRSQEAIAPAEEAVAVFQRLAASNPAAYEVRLFMALNTLSSGLLDAGRKDDALNRIKETGALRRLAKDNPIVYEPQLAMALNTLSNCLAGTEPGTSALAAAMEAVALYRNSARRNPIVYEPKLAGTLNTFSTRLAEVGLKAEGVDAAEEALEIFQGLADSDPVTYEPDLAMTLTNLSLRLASAQRKPEAAASARESIRVYKRLAARNPRAYEPDLAKTLWTVAWRKADDPDALHDALDAAKQSIVIYKRLRDSRLEAIGYLQEVEELQALILRNIARVEEAHKTGSRRLPGITYLDPRANE